MGSNEFSLRRHRPTSRGRLAVRHSLGVETYPLDALVRVMTTHVEAVVFPLVALGTLGARSSTRSFLLLFDLKDFKLSVP